MAAPIMRRASIFAYRRMSTLSKSVQAQIARQYKVMDVPPSTSLLDIIAANKEVLGQEIKSHANAMKKLELEAQRFYKVQQELNSCMANLAGIFEELGISRRS